MKINVAHAFVTLCILLPVSLVAQTTQAPKPPAMAMSMPHEHQHGAGVAVTYAELANTAALLEKARRATEKYRDVHVAEAEGYLPIGPDVPGMGIHFTKTTAQSTPEAAMAFDIEHPPILLYEKDQRSPSGYSLVGVSYLLTAERGEDDQPLNSPLPRSLARWHRHESLCIFSDRSVRSAATETQCIAQGGGFTAQTPWMVHVWIWKDSPTGVFSPTNPAVL